MKTDAHPTREEVSQYSKKVKIQMELLVLSKETLKKNPEIYVYSVVSMCPDTLFYGASFKHCRLLIIIYDAPTFIIAVSLE